MTHAHYLLLASDAIFRILLAFLFFFVLVPRWIVPADRAREVLERLWWNLGLGIIALTLIGQILTFFRIYSLATLLLSIGLAVLVSRSVRKGVSLPKLIREDYTELIVTGFNILDRRINVPRRLRRWLRRSWHRMRSHYAEVPNRWKTLRWGLLILVAAGFRFYRPLLGLDLGLSDAYVHLYWLKLLETGHQVDASWGPYPRGMHFVLMAFRVLTNVDDVLLVNFFGAFVGVLMVVAVANVAQRISRSEPGGLLAGLAFATMVGGEAQYWVLGGSYDSNTLPRGAIWLELWGRKILYLPETLPHSSFDMMFGSFLRQTVTLPQELAVVLLFPAGLFLLDYFRRRDLWYLAGYAGCGAAIAATHPGVGLALVLLVAAAFVPPITGGHLRALDVRRFISASLIAMLAGFSWALGFILYPRTGDWVTYAPFLRELLPKMGVQITEEFYVSTIYPNTTRALLAVLVMCVILAVLAFYPRRERRGGGLWMAVVTLLLAVVQVSTLLGMPTLISPDRNAVWLMMAMSITVMTTAATFFNARGKILSRRIGRIGIGALLMLVAGLWLNRIPAFDRAALRDTLADRTVYGAIPRVVLEIERMLEPFTWTMVTYGQEFPQVWGRGYHMQGSKFLGQYDPVDRDLAIPTRYVFIVVEKRPHPFQIRAWAKNFTRTDIENRLQAWCVLYQTSHRDMKVFLDDDNVRIYVVQRSKAEAERISRSLERTED